MSLPMGRLQMTISLSNWPKGALLWHKTFQRYGIKVTDTVADVFHINWLSGSRDMVSRVNCIMVAKSITLPPPPEADGA